MGLTTDNAAALVAGGNKDAGAERRVRIVAPCLVRGAHVDPVDENGNPTVLSVTARERDDLVEAGRAVDQVDEPAAEPAPAAPQA